MMQSLARLVLEPLLDLCYPAICAICGSTGENPPPLCAQCEQKLIDLESASACPRCAMPLPRRLAPCPWCHGKGLYPFAQIERLGIFDDPLRKMIHQVKYHRRWPIAELLAKRLWQRPQVREMLANRPALMAVPLHYRRHLSRGYNQAQIIAQQLHHLTGLPLLHPTQRLRDTPSQTQVGSRQARLRNMRDAFVLLTPQAVQGRHIVVINDVMTTGATLHAVGRALLPARPASITALVLAIADPRARGFKTI